MICVFKYTKKVMVGQQFFEFCHQICDYIQQKQWLWSLLMKTILRFIVILEDYTCNKALYFLQLHNARLVPCTAAASA